MKTMIKEVQGFARDSIPEEDETILDEFGIKLENIVEFRIYERIKEECPLNRGNIVADITFIDGPMVCIKLPLEMGKNEESILKYFKPIIDHLNSMKNNSLH